MSDANDLRGEVDLELDGQRFVLRPSYTAIVAMEKKTGRPLAELASLADQVCLPQELAAIATVEMIRAWGRELVVDEYASPEQKAMATAARGINTDMLGGLLYSFGTVPVQSRLALVLTLALNGGCLPSGELKPTTGTMTTTEIPAVGLQE